MSPCRPVMSLPPGAYDENALATLHALAELVKMEDLREGVALLEECQRGYVYSLGDLPIHPSYSLHRFTMPPTHVYSSYSPSHFTMPLIHLLTHSSPSTINNTITIYNNNTITICNQ